MYIPYDTMCNAAVKSNIAQQRHGHPSRALTQDNPILYANAHQMAHVFFLTRPSLNMYTQLIIRKPHTYIKSSVTHSEQLKKCFFLSCSLSLPIASRDVLSH